MKKEMSKCDYLNLFVLYGRKLGSGVERSLWLMIGFLMLFFDQPGAIAQDKKDASKNKLWISEVKYQDPATKIYLGSPSILRLNKKEILVTLDYFGANRPKDNLGRSNKTSVYKSVNEGKSWKHISDIDGMYWANLFEHKGKIYLLGTTSANGSIAIRRTDDGGKSWTSPINESTGLLFKEGINGAAPRYHGAPTPVVKHKGRLYRAFENVEDNTVRGMRGYRVLVVSIDENDDLLDASKWTMSNQLSFDAAAWDPPKSFSTTGWLEGNMVEGTDGRLWNILRVNSTPFYDRAAMVEIVDEGKKVVFTPDNFIKFPGAQSKFVIRKDDKTGVYWAMVNNNTNGKEANQRNVLSLYASKDLRNWYPAKTLMEDNQGFSEKESIALTGFQYPDWQFDGKNIIYLSRTAYGEGVPRAHDSNRITFGRIEDFRKLTPEDLKK
ncbi:sialidase family protein [Pseudopedobacter beijingensis]|uniref:Sialidase family protein n=1 Tax=Pseudopedobacter beijingensis TaxID=1207056 RepID=A0ABW4I6W8_9SPHI